MNQLQWQEVEAIVRKKQIECIKYCNYEEYDRLKKILDELYVLAHRTVLFGDLK